MAEQLSPEERLKLIYLNLAEVLKPEIVEHVVLTEDRPLKIYWGMVKLTPVSAATVKHSSRHCNYRTVG